MARTRLFAHGAAILAVGACLSVPAYAQRQQRGPGGDAREGAQSEQGGRRGGDDARGERDRGRSAGRDGREGRHDREPAGVPGAIVINPITIGSPPTIGSISPSRPVTVGQRVVVGSPAGSSTDDAGGRSPFGAGSPDRGGLPGTSGSSPRLDHNGRRVVPIPVFVFTPWYPIGARLMAGLPVRFPAADTSDSPATSTSRQRVADGGISLDVTPAAADVFVDGVRAGRAAEFTPGRGPLALAAGPHTVELRNAGFRTERFDVMIPLGEVLPLAGALEQVP